MRTRIPGALVVLLALLVAMPAVAQTKLKFAHVYETSEAFHTEALWAASEIAKRTNNKYQVEVFPASALGNEQQISQPCRSAPSTWPTLARCSWGLSTRPSPS